MNARTSRPGLAPLAAPLGSRTELRPRQAAVRLVRNRPAVCSGTKAPVPSPMPGLMAAGAAALVALQTLPARAGPLLAATAGFSDVDAARSLLVIAALGFAAFSIISWQTEQANMGCAHWPSQALSSTSSQDTASYKVPESAILRHQLV